MKRAGKVSDIDARAMVTLPSSSGCQCNNSEDRDSSGMVGATRVPTFSYYWPSTLFPAQGQEAVVRIYRSGLVGRTGYKFIFERYDEKQGKFDFKFSAFAATQELAGELHRGHCYRVRFNQEPRNPQIVEIVEVDVQVT